jgi:hypothetical protein
VDGSYCRAFGGGCFTQYSLLATNKNVSIAAIGLNQSPYIGVSGLLNAFVVLIPYLEENVRLQEKLKYRFKNLQPDNPRCLHACLYSKFSYCRT